LINEQGWIPMRVIVVVVVALSLACVSPVVAGEFSPWRSTITLPEDPRTIPALDAFVIADQLGDSTVIASTLARDDWAPHLRDWCAARWEKRQGRLRVSLDLYEHAAVQWPSQAGEPDLVLTLFDQERLGVALALGDSLAANSIVRSPLRPHHDSVWRALRARVELESGDAAAAVDRMVRAWDGASAVDRRHPAFLHGALAHLALDQNTEAVEAWQASISVIRRPERLRDAARIWDQSPGLHAAVTAYEDPTPTLRFLVRILRREEALEIVQARLDGEVGERVEQQLFVAEQLYRLREHDRLLSWLAETDREEWEAEQQAQADGYRWGIARRGGSSVEVARGFDAIAETWPDTPRAAEAWWEAAWMYELSDLPEEAVARYARHVESTSSGRFRSSAALRTVFLPWRSAAQDESRAALAHYEAALGTGMDQAAAWWLMSLSDLASSEEWSARLREEHPASPLWRGLGPEIAAAEAPTVSALFATQEKGFRRVAEALGLNDPLQELPESLVPIVRIAELGLRTEATVRLDAWAREHRSDDLERYRAVAVAFRSGLPEMQGRHGWFLERRLRGREPDLDVGLRAISLPTPFAGTLIGISHSLDLSPAVLWALMRRESFFDADIVSLAGAYGLMQLLPRTARRMAGTRGLPEPSPSDLFVPAMNLRLGASYLAQLREEASGNWVRALASYNAGEINGERWEARLRPSEDPAVGILLISYTETRSYVYNVLRVAHHYEDVWRAGF
jgi:soluble lytic murein transglycosylase-like protein